MANQSHNFTGLCPERFAGLETPPIVTNSEHMMAQDGFPAYAQLEVLVAYITAPETVNDDVVSDFLMTFRHFTTEFELWTLLASRLLWAAETAARTGNESETGTEVGRRTFVVMRTWIREFFATDFVPSVELRQLAASTLTALSGCSEFVLLDFFQRILLQLRTSWDTEIAEHWSIAPECIGNIDLPTPSGGEPPFSTSCFTSTTKFSKLSELPLSLLAGEIPIDADIAVTSIHCSPERRKPRRSISKMVLSTFTAPLKSRRPDHSETGNFKRSAKNDVTLQNRVDLLGMQIIEEYHDRERQTFLPKSDSGLALASVSGLGLEHNTPNFVDNSPGRSMPLGSQSMSPIPNTYFAPLVGSQSAHGGTSQQISSDLLGRLDARQASPHHHQNYQYQFLPHQVMSHPAITYHQTTPSRQNTPQHSTYDSQTTPVLQLRSDLPPPSSQESALPINVVHTSPEQNIMGPNLIPTRSDRVGSYLSEPTATDSDWSESELDQGASVHSLRDPEASTSLQTEPDGDFIRSNNRTPEFSGAHTETDEDEGWAMPRHSLGPVTDSIWYAGVSTRPESQIQPKPMASEKSADTLNVLSMGLADIPDESEAELNLNLDLLPKTDDTELPRAEDPERQSTEVSRPEPQPETGVRTSSPHHLASSTISPLSTEPHSVKPHLLEPTSQPQLMTPQMTPSALAFMGPSMTLPRSSTPPSPPPHKDLYPRIGKTQSIQEHSFKAPDVNDFDVLDLNDFDHGSYHGSSLSTISTSTHSAFSFHGDDTPLTNNSSFKRLRDMRVQQFDPHCLPDENVISQKQNISFHFEDSEVRTDVHSTSSISLISEYDNSKMVPCAGFTSSDKDILESLPVDRITDGDALLTTLQRLEGMSFEHNDNNAAAEALLAAARHRDVESSLVKNSPLNADIAPEYPPTHSNIPHSSTMDLYTAALDPTDQPLQRTENSNRKMHEQVLDHEISQLGIALNELPDPNRGHHPNYDLQETPTTYATPYEEHKAPNGLASPFGITQSKPSNSSETAYLDYQPELPKPLPTLHIGLPGASHAPFILAYGARAIAEQMTLIEREVAQRIDCGELICMRWPDSVMKPGSWLQVIMSEVPPDGIALVEARFNLVYRWVQSEILLCPYPGLQAQTISRFIQVAFEALRLQNFATMVQLVQALTSSEVKSRVGKHVFELLPAHDRDCLERLESLSSAHQNFSRLKKAHKRYASWKGCIPYTRMFLQDIELTARACSSNTEKEIHFSKYRVCAHLVRALRDSVASATNYKFPLDTALFSKCLYLSSLPELSS